MSQLVTSSSPEFESPRKSAWPILMLIIAITCGPAVMALAFSLMLR